MGETKDDIVSINATSVRLPTFSPNQPLTWFRRAERHFNLKKITSSTTKADYVIEVLPESVFQQISPWLDTQPAEIKFEDLKSTLLTKFCPTPAVRAHRILDLPHQSQQDRTPLSVWHEINMLQQLPDIDSDTNLPKKLDLIKEIWLMCLPRDVRSALFNTDNREINDLVTEAEQRYNATKAATSSQPKYVTAIGLKADQTPSDSTSISSFICFYHKRFGNNARKCLEGCQYQSKNLLSGRI